jgi:hypothetical protein
LLLIFISENPVSQKGEQYGLKSESSQHFEITWSHSDRHVNNANHPMFKPILGEFQKVKAQKP